MADSSNTVLLSIKLDEGKVEQQLAKLVLDIEQTKAAQKELTKARDADKISAEEYSKQSVKLSNQLTVQRGEQRALTKDLGLFQEATAGTGTSYRELQSTLSLVERQFQQTAGSADLSTESARALSDIIDDLRNTLKKTDAQQSLFVRQVGAHPATAEAASQATQEYSNNLVGLRQKLADLSKERETADVGTERFEKLNRAILDTRTAVQQAEGKIDEFGDKVQKNSKREDLDTLGDAFGGVTATIQLSSLAMDDQEDVAQLTAKATQFLAQAEALRNIQIGLANAKDAVAIGLQQARNLLFTQQAAAVGPRPPPQSPVRPPP